MGYVSREGREWSGDLLSADLPHVKKHHDFHVRTVPLKLFDLPLPRRDENPAEGVVLYEGEKKKTLCLYEASSYRQTQWS